MYVLLIGAVRPCWFKYELISAEFLGVEFELNKSSVMEF